MAATEASPQLCRENCGETAVYKKERRGVLGFLQQLRSVKSGRQDLNLRPLGPEPAPPAVPAFGPAGRSSQPFDNTGLEGAHDVESLPRVPADGGDGTASPEQVAADLRQTQREFLRPEDLLPVTLAAQLLGVSVATVHNAINAGKLRCHLFGSARRVRPEDLDAYVQARAADRPPVGEDWCTVKELMRAAGVSRAQAYRLLERGAVPFRVFAGVRYIRNGDIAVLAKSNARASRRDGGSR